MELCGNWVTGGTAITSFPPSLLFLLSPLPLLPLFPLSLDILSSRLVRVLLEQVVSSTIERCVDTVLMEQSVRFLWLRGPYTRDVTPYITGCHLA